jgi:putative hemolysin
VAIAFSLVTFMHVVFGELMPKAVALQTPDKTALWVAPPLNVFARISRPVVAVMNGTGNWLLRRIGYTPSGTEGHVHSVEELRLIVEDAEEAGRLDEDQAEFVMNVFALADKTVRDCMVPRDTVMALDVNTPPERVLEVARLGATPACRSTTAPWTTSSASSTPRIYSSCSAPRGSVVLEDALYPATFLDPDEPVANAFRLFRKSHRHMSVVRDEKGVVHGLLTLEDVLEEIVGDIEDEHDVPVPKLKLARRRAILAKATPSAVFKAADSRERRKPEQVSGVGCEVVSQARSVSKGGSACPC